MIRSNLRSLGARVVARLPAPPDVLEGRRPDADAIGRGATLLAIAGLAVSAVGAIVRYLVGRRGTDTQPGLPETDEPGNGSASADGHGAGSLVGLAALVSMRLFVEWLEKEPPADD